jgi:hypothetical protein
MGQLATGLLSLSGWAALAALFTLPALETPAFLGLVLPGELALLLGGVLAHQDRIPLAVGAAGALAGDTAGSWIGRHWGPRLLSSGLGRRVGPARLHTVEGLLLRGGGWALVVGRCTAGARVLLPGLAGMLGLATESLCSGPGWPPWSGRWPMSCSATPPVLAGATPTTSAVGPASPSPWPWWWRRPSPGWSTARPGGTRTSQPSRSPQGGAPTRPAPGRPRAVGSRSDPAARAGVPGPHREPGELDRVCDCYGPVTRGES